MLASLGLSLVSLALALGPLSHGFQRTSKTNGFLRLALDQQDRPWNDNSSVFERGGFQFAHCFIIETVMLPASGKVNRLSGEKRVPKESAHDVISCISCRRTHTHTLYIIVLLPCKTKFYMCVICAFVYFPHIKDCQQRDIWTHMDIISWHDTCNVMQ